MRRQYFPRRQKLSNENFGVGHGLHPSELLVLEAPEVLPDSTAVAADVGFLT